MANRESYPANQSPLQGDIDGSAGEQLVTVTGIQTIPVDPTTPQPQQLLVMGSDGVWHPEDPVVSGTDAIGTPSTKNPVQVAGVDEGGLVREIRTDTTGGLHLTARIEDFLYQVVLELRAVKAAVLSLDSTAIDAEFDAQEFEDGVE